MLVLDGNAPELVRAISMQNAQPEASVRALRHQMARSPNRQRLLRLWPEPVQDGVKPSSFSAMMVR
jgi:hypothetical protein